MVTNDKKVEGRVCEIAPRGEDYKFSDQPGVEQIGELSGEAYHSFIWLVDTRAKEKDGEVISNRDQTHAAYLIIKMIRLAAELGQPIRIVTGKATFNFYRFMIKPIFDAFSHKQQKSDFSVEVAILDPDADVANNDFVHAILSKGGKVYHASARLDNEPKHFTLVGERIYREELDDSKAIAKASFNDLEVGRKLLADFKRLLGDPKMCELRYSVSA